MMIANIRNLREDNDLTIEMAGEIVGVSKSTYGRWETDEEIIPAKHLNSLCNYYQVSMDYMVGFSKIKNFENITNTKLNKELIGKRLRTFRKKHKLTQKLLADSVHSNRVSVSDYERGKTELKVDFAYETAKKYNVSLDYLYGRSEDMCIKTK